MSQRRRVGGVRPRHPSHAACPHPNAGHVGFGRVAPGAAPRVPIAPHPSTSYGYDLSPTGLHRRSVPSVAARAAAPSNAASAASRFLPPSTAPLSATAAPRRRRHRSGRLSGMLCSRWVVLFWVAAVIVGLDLLYAVASLTARPVPPMGHCPTLNTLGTSSCTAGAFIASQLALPSEPHGPYTVFHNFRVAARWGPGGPAHALAQSAATAGVGGTPPMRSQQRPPTIVSIVTQITPDRADRLQRLVERWDGPVTAVLYVCSVADLEAVAEVYDSSQHMLSHLTLHVMVGRSHFLPINAMRNVATTSVQRDFEWQFVLDVDALPSASMASFVADLALAVDEAEEAAAERGEPRSVAHDRTIYVAPALEITDRIVADASRLATTATGAPVPAVAAAALSAASSSIADSPVDVFGLLPEDKASLRRLYSVDAARTMHATSCSTSYGGPFKLEDWLATERPYAIPYERGFEGYYIVRGPVVPFDERFVGRRRNKQSQYFEMHAQGYGITVLPQSWVVDVPHTPTMEPGRVEAINTRKWAEFLSDMLEKYPESLTCPPGRKCWWVEENLESRWQVWGLVEAFWHTRECAALAATAADSSPESASLVRSVSWVGGRHGAGLALGVDSGTVGRHVLQGAVDPEAYAPPPPPPPPPPRTVVAPDARDGTLTGGAGGDDVATSGSFRLRGTRRLLLA